MLIDRTFWHLSFAFRKQQGSKRGQTAWNQCLSCSIRAPHAPPLSQNHVFTLDASVCYSLVSFLRSNATRGSLQLKHVVSLEVLWRKYVGAFFKRLVVPSVVTPTFSKPSKDVPINLLQSRYKPNLSGACQESPLHSIFGSFARPTWLRAQLSHFHRRFPPPSSFERASRVIK